MRSTKKGLLISIAIIGLLIGSAVMSSAETANYVYDELNRLTRVEYGNGTIIEYTYDQAGNRTAITTSIVDTTPPVTTATPAGGTYTSAQDVTLTCNDGAGSGCDPNKLYYSTDGYDPAILYTSPIHIATSTTLKFYSIDLAGNSETVKTETYTINIDTTPPVTTATPAGGTYTTAQTVTLTCNDGTGSGCDKIYYTTDGSTPTTSSSVYTSPINISTTTTLKYFSMDLAGNSETVKTESYTINLDTTPPVTTATPAGGTYTTAQSVTLTCNDGTGSGCDKIYYTTDGSTPTPSSSIYSTPINISATTTLKYFATDNAGNSEAFQTQTYTIISSYITINGGASYTKSRNVTLSLFCSDANGCLKMRFSNNGSTFSTAEAYAPTKAWTLNTGNGTKTVYVKFQNQAGVWSATFSDTIILDTKAPTTTNTPLAGTYTGSVDVTLSCSDNSGGSGCANTYYTMDGSTPTTSSPVYASPLHITATTTLKFFSTDNVGNSGAVKKTTYRIK